MALTSLNKRTYDLRGSRIYMHTESSWGAATPEPLVYFFSGKAVFAARCTAGNNPKQFEIDPKLPENHFLFDLQSYL